MKQRSSGITALLLDYACAEPPVDLRAVMRLSLLDWAACGIAGQAEGTFVSWAAALKGEGVATLMPPTDSSSRLQTMSVVTAVVRGGTYEGSKNSFDT